MERLEQEAILKNFFILLASIACLLLLIFLFVRNSRSKNPHKYPQGTSHWIEKINASTNWCQYKTIGDFTCVLNEAEFYWDINLFAINKCKFIQKHNLLNQCKIHLSYHINEKINPYIADSIECIDLKYRSFFETKNNIQIKFPKTKMQSVLITWIEDYSLMLPTVIFFLESMLSITKELNLKQRLIISLDKGIFLSVEFSIESETFFRLKNFIHELTKTLPLHTSESGIFIVTFCVAFNDQEIPHFLIEKFKNQLENFPAA